MNETSEPWNVRLDTLPIPLTPLIGRDEEVAALVSLMAEGERRLVTLTGPGGVGKTRLALAAGAALAGSFHDGVVFVPLSPVADPGLVGRTITTALGVPESPGRSVEDTLGQALHHRRLLLVLDNFEHVLPAAPLVATLLSRCPRISVLVTSRAPLRLSGEQEWPVAPLALPQPVNDGPRMLTVDDALSSPAVQLFVDRARAVRPDFPLTDETAAVVAAICARLDGLPLALELAAARVRLLPAPMLLDRLEASLELLGDGPRDLPARQRTLRDTIQWSYGLLTAAEQALFRRLAVCPAGCTLDTAQALGSGLISTGPVFEPLSALVEQSLVQQRTDPDGTPRYTMLRTVRDFARERLQLCGEEVAAEGALLAHIVNLCNQASEALFAGGYPHWAARWESERDNLRAALSWAIKRQDVESAFLVLSGIGIWMRRRSFLELGHWLDLAMALSGADVPTTARGRALIARADVYFQMAYHHHEVVSISREAARIFRAAGDIPRLIYALGWIGLGASSWLGGAQLAAVESETVEATELAEKLQVPWLLGWAWLGHGLVQLSLERRKLAQASLEAAMHHMLQSGDNWLAAPPSYFLGQMAVAVRDFARARRLYSQGLAWNRQAGDIHMIIYFHYWLEHVALEEGDFTDALVQLREGINLAWLVGSTSLISYGFVEAAEIAARLGKDDTAASFLGAAQVPVSPRRGLTDGTERQLMRAPVILRARLGERRLEALKREGATRPLEEMIAEALDFTVTGPPSVQLATAGDQAPRASVSQSGPIATLTEREREILALVAAGKSNRELAGLLVISPHTVAHHLTAILNKLGVNNRAEAAAAAIRAGIDGTTPQN